MMPAACQNFPSSTQTKAIEADGGCNKKQQRAATFPANTSRSILRGCEKVDRLAATGCVGAGVIRGAGRTKGSSGWEPMMGAWLETVGDRSIVLQVGVVGCWHCADGPAISAAMDRNIWQALSCALASESADKRHSRAKASMGCAAACSMSASNTSSGVLLGIDKERISVLLAGNGDCCFGGGESVREDGGSWTVMCMRGSK